MALGSTVVHEIYKPMLVSTIARNKYQVVVGSYPDV